MHSSVFKAIAREALRGKWQKMAWIVFVGTLISGGIQLNAGEIKPTFQLNFTMADPGTIRMVAVALLICVFLALLIGAWVNVGMYNLSKRLLEKEEPRMGMLFPRKIIWRAIAMNVLRALIVYGAMIILAVATVLTGNMDVLVTGLIVAYVPAFFLSYCYAMADYLLLTDPRMSPVRALRESRMRMRGFKSALFWLELSFIGWSLLIMLPQLLVMNLLIGISEQVAIVTGFAVSLVCGAFVSVYQVVAKTAFFRELEKPDDGYDEKRRAKQAAAQRMAEEQQAPAPEAEKVVDSDEACALFMEYGCSRRAMANAGALEEYLNMNIDSSMETRWMREYADSLIRRFDRDAEALEKILRFASEYAHEEILDRALMRIDRHLSQNTLPVDDVLGMAGRVLALLNAGVFDENPGYIRRKKAQIGEIIAALEHRACDADALALVKQML